MDNNRIGQIDGESIRWPEADLRGQSYTRPPAMTVQIGGGSFVVVPAGMSKDEMNTLIDALKPSEPLKSERTKGRIASEPESVS